jgi:hypothetical protein
MSDTLPPPLHFSNISDFEYFASGCAHVLFKTTTTNSDPVLLRLYKHRIHTATDITHHLDILANFWTPLLGSAHLLPCHPVTLCPVVTTELLAPHSSSFGAMSGHQIAHGIIMPQISAIYELKPKSGLPDVPGGRTRAFRRAVASGQDPGVAYDPEILFRAVLQGRKAEIFTAVETLVKSRFLRVSGNSSYSEIDRLTEILTSESARHIFRGLLNAQQTGLDEHAQIALCVLEMIGEETVKRLIVRAPLLHLDVLSSEKFASIGRGIVARLSEPGGCEEEEMKEAVGWIKRFLLARAAMDVSILVDEDGGLTVVDLDMKPVEKIRIYASESL